MTSQRRSGLVIALAAAVISGFSVYVNSLGVKAVGDATTYTTAKNAVAGLILLVVVGAGVLAGNRREVRVTAPRTPAGWAALLGIGVVGGSVPFVLFFTGLSLTAAPQAAFLQKTLVLWVALLAVVVLKERLGVAHWLAIVLLLGGQWWLGAQGAFALDRGAVLILAATLLWAVETVVAKWLLASVSAWTVGLTRMGVGSVVLLVWLAVTGRLGTLGALTVGKWGWVVLTGVLLAAYVATWLAALARLQAVDVTAVLVLAAVVTALVNATVAGTVPANIPALAVLVAGVGLVIGAMLRRPSAAPVVAE